MLSVGKIVESKGCGLTGHTAQIRVQKDAFGITSALKSVIIWEIMFHIDVINCLKLGLYSNVSSSSFNFENSCLNSASQTVHLSYAII